MDTATRESTEAPQRLFFAALPSERVMAAIRRAMTAYEEYIEYKIPEELWHLTLLFLGDCPSPTGYVSRLKKPLPQAYMPTITLTHMGRGLVQHQLWVYAVGTPLMETIQTQMTERLKQMRFSAPALKTKRPFVPHIHVANLRPGTPTSLADAIVTTTFSMSTIHLLSSQQVEGRLSHTNITSVPFNL